MRWQVLLILIAIEVIYLCIGGVIFWALETRKKVVNKPAVPDTVNCFNVTSFIERLVRIDNGSCFKNNSQTRSIILQQLNESHISNICGSSTSTSESDEDGWDYFVALFFAMTVVTTIGYGNVVPSTSGSQVFCCFYAVIGIPFTMVLLMAVGEKLNLLANLIDERIRKQKTGTSKAGRSTVIFLLGGVFFLVIPAAVFTGIEGWGYGISIYFGMITLLTIGFGDYVAGFDCTGSACWLYRISVGIWIFLGLAWLAGLLSSIQESFQEIFKNVDENPILDQLRNLCKKKELTENKEEVGIETTEEGTLAQQENENASDAPAIGIEDISFQKTSNSLAISKEETLFQQENQKPIDELAFDSSKEFNVDDIEMKKIPN